MSTVAKTVKNVVLFLLLISLSACGSSEPAPPATETVPSDTAQRQPTIPSAEAGVAQSVSSPTTDSTAPAASPTPTAAPTMTPAPSPTSTLGPTELACEAEGYACSLDEMSEETFDRATAYAETAGERMRQGASTFEIVDWLRQQEGVEAPVTDGRAIIYHVDGSVPVVVEHPGVAEDARAPTQSNQVARFDLGRQRSLPSLSLPAFLEVPAAHAQPIISEPTGVVGSQREDRNTKRALVLAPYLWEFGEGDESPQVAELLARTRWYQDNVTFVANAERSEQNVTFEHFLNWQQYDTIHVATHGRSLCWTEMVCTTYLQTGEWMSKEEVLALNEHHDGISMRISADPETERERNEVELLILSDFFKAHYDAGALKNKIIYLSACEMVVKSDMVDSLAVAAENSDLFAWTYSVYSQHAKNLALDVYEKMAVRGQSAGDAYRRIPDEEKLDRPAVQPAGHEYYRYYGIEQDEEGKLELIDRTQTTDFRHYTLGQETNNHVREVVTLLNPEQESLLTPGTVYPIDGTLGDGEPEQIELLFKVEGYTQPEIETEDIILGFTLNDQSLFSNRAFLPAGTEDVEVTQQGDYEWLVRIDGVEIPDQQPDAELTFEAQLQLPGGDDSVHTVAPIRTSRPDVRAILQQPPLQAGQSVVITYDRDAQAVRTDVDMQGQSVSMFHDRQNQRAYMPDGQGGYWYHDGGDGDTDLVLPFAQVFIPVDWRQHRVEEAGFTKEEYACNDGQTCTQYHKQEGSQALTLIYDEQYRLIEFGFASSDGEGSIVYEYDEYNVQVPANASPSPLPDLSFPSGGMSGGLPDLSETP